MDNRWPETTTTTTKSSEKSRFFTQTLIWFFGYRRWDLRVSFCARPPSAWSNNIWPQAKSFKRKINSSRKEEQVHRCIVPRDFYQNVIKRGWTYQNSQGQTTTVGNFSRSRGIKWKVAWVCINTMQPARGTKLKFFSSLQ